MNYLTFKGRRPRHILSVPFIYIVSVGVVICDVLVELFHRVAFPLYGLEYVKRSEYIRIDRHRLKYLKFFQKINCMYCGYVNGFFAYALAIAGRTEQYWCAIKHKSDPGRLFYPPQHQKHFLPYDDEGEYAKLKTTKKKRG